MNKSESRSECGLQTLCQTCQNIFNELLTEPMPYPTFIPYFSNTSFIKVAASNGCLLCGQVLQTLKLTLSMERDIDIERSEVFVRSLKHENATPDSSSSLPSWELTTPRFTDTLNDGAVKLLVTAWPNNNHEISTGNFINYRDLEAGLPLVKRWLQNCLSHRKCCVAEEPFLPTRLIYVGDKRPRLALSKSIEGIPKYATLSHCWGGMKFVTLSENNLNLFLTQIPPEALNQTFRDAIDVVRTLGINYLWIDCLCIIQDKDSDDWAKESSQMALVYGSSGLNIAATAAVDGSRGLFKNTDSSFNARAKLDGREMTYQCVPVSLYRDSMTWAPLCRRGWVLQERILAPRTIHFTKSQLFWECNEVAACESFQESLPKEMKMPWALTVPQYQEKVPVANYSWVDIVRRYSHCKLTVASDKMVAIAGIASKFQESQNGEYLAGLWGGDDFLRQLCWSCENHCFEVPKIPHSVDYQGPTWSWSSVNSIVRFPRENDPGTVHIPHLQLLETEIVLSSTDRYGAVKEARLTLLCDGLFVLGREGGYGEGSLGRIRINGMINNFNSAIEGLDSLFFMPVQSPLDLKHHQTGQALPATFQLLCASNSIKETTGLILRRANLERRGEYQRVGMFDVNSIVGCGDGDEQLPDSAYYGIERGPDGTERYKITLI